MLTKLIFSSYKLLMATSSLMMHLVTKLKSPLTGHISVAVSTVTSITSLVTRSESTTPLGCFIRGDPQCECAAAKFAELMRCSHVTHENSGYFERTGSVPKQYSSGKSSFFSPLHSAEHSLPSFDIDSRQVYLIDTLAHRPSTFI